MFSAVTHVLSQAANGAMYLVGGNNENEQTPATELPPVSIDQTEMKHEIQSKPETIPMEPRIPPETVAAPVATPATTVNKEVTDVKEVPNEVAPPPEERDEFDLSKWT